MKKKEQKWTTLFMKFLKYHAEGSHPIFNRSVLWEVKTGSKDKSIPLSSVSTKQLLTLSKHRFVYKFSDISRMGTPCDGLFIPRDKASLGIVVLSWEQPGARDHAYIYPYEIWMDILKNHPARSMTLDQAKETAFAIIKIN
jgi:hypothetical protein